MPLLNNARPQVMVAERTADNIDLEFHRVTLDVLPLILPYLRRSASRTCDYSAGGIMMWVDYFNYEYAIAADTLFIKGLDENDRSREAFAVPLGSLPLTDAIDVLARYCSGRRQPLVLSAVPEEYIPALTMLGAADIRRLDSWADYLYNAADLASLEGHVFNKKRNHVNRFLADNPDAVLEDITEENIPEILDFIDRIDITGKADIAMAEYEREQTRAVFAAWPRYHFVGAALRASGRIVAFTAGEIIGDTLILHIEKMNHEVAGAGEAINKFFAAHILAENSEIRYINREDDAGDPGLRRAKESYHPVRLLAKYDLTIPVGL